VTAFEVLLEPVIVLRLVCYLSSIIHEMLLYKVGHKNVAL